MENKMQVTTNVVELKSTVENSFPSVWSKDDVMRLLDQVQVNVLEQASKTDEYAMPTLTQEAYDDAMSLMDEAFDKMDSAIEEISCEEDNIELSINYGREISIDNIEIEGLHELKEEFADLRKFMEAFMQKLKPTASETEETEETEA